MTFWGWLRHIIVDEIRSRMTFGHFDSMKLGGLNIDPLRHKATVQEAEEEDDHKAQKDRDTESKP